MKKVWVVMVAAAWLLAGCGSEETFETVADQQVLPAAAVMREILVELPEEAAAPTVESASDRLYVCQDYEISVQVLQGGDLNATIQTLSGYQQERLTVMQSSRDLYDCYEFVWASAGETGDRVGRAMILDDGNYHYCVSILGDADAARANQVYWDEMFGSVTLS